MAEDFDPDRYRVTADGIRYTTTLPDTGRARGDVKPYVLVWLADAAKAFAAMNCQKAMVYVWIVYKVKVTGNRTVDVTNDGLLRYGVDAKAKQRALKQLEADGVIAIDQRPNRNPTVTLL